jgi:hypothetical protein
MGNFEDIIINFGKKLGGETVFQWFLGLRFAVVQTKPKAPDPIRTPKLSGFRHG